VRSYAVVPPTVCAVQCAATQETMVLDPVPLRFRAGFPLAGVPCR
jgi:hypothetical protein